MKGYPDAEDHEIAEIVRGFLTQQTRAAAEQTRPIRRGTHAKGVCARAVFEVLDVTHGRDPALAAILAGGIYATPRDYPATVRFANSDPTVNSDWQPDVRGFSFWLDLTGSGADGVRQDYSLQSAPTLPFNDVHAFAVYARVVGAPNEAVALGAMPFDDQLVYARTKSAVEQQQRQPVRPYQQLRYWSNVPFRHGPDYVVKYSATPAAANPTHPLDKDNPNALRAELVRHLRDDSVMSAFDFGLQFLDLERMTYQGTRRDAQFWVENASVEWPEDFAPFHTVARLTLVKGSQFSDAECEGTAFDVTGNSTAFSAPVGAVNRARWYAEVASRKAREGAR